VDALELVGCRDPLQVRVALGQFGVAALGGAAEQGVRNGPAGESEQGRQHQEHVETAEVLTQPGQGLCGRAVRLPPHRAEVGRHGRREGGPLHQVTGRSLPVGRDLLGGAQVVQRGQIGGQPRGSRRHRTGSACGGQVVGPLGDTALFLLVNREPVLTGRADVTRHAEQPEQLDLAAGDVVLG